MTRNHRIAATLAGLLLAASLSACADPGATDSPTVTADATTPTDSSPQASIDTSPVETASEVSTEHNAADTMFAQMMIVHHEGAVEMSDLAIERSETPEVVDLAEGISEAQGPEIAEMTAWLTAWGEETTAPDHGGMDMGGMDMNGMTQEEMMSHLDGMSGTEFDQAFLEGMIAHHQGAVEMAEAELAGGQNPEALALAEKIIADQQAEITVMEDLIANL